MFLFRDILHEVSPVLVKYLVLKWVVMYPGDLEPFELVPLCRELVHNSWERPRIFCDKEGMEYMQLEDKFTDLFCYIFDHTNEVYYKCFIDLQENDDGYYVLGYISVKIVNEFIRELVIESAYLNGYGYTQVENFPFS